MNNVWRKIYGYCGGYFGRDNYADKMIIAEGYDWIVCSYSDFDLWCKKDVEYKCFAFFKYPELKQEYIDDWARLGGEEDFIPLKNL